MKAAWGPSEYVALIMLSLGGIWIAAKLLGAFWNLAAPVVGKYFTVRVDGRNITSSYQHESTAVKDNRDTNFDGRLSVKQTGETVKYTIAKRETDNFTFPDVFTGLARLVLEKKLTETDALKIACKVNPGKDPKYKAARDYLHKAMETETADPFPNLRAQQKPRYMGEEIEV